jgi:hypothetical protein
MADQYLDDPLGKIRAGWMGPDNTKQFQQQLNESIGGLRSSAAGYLSSAAGRAGYVPRGLAGRMSAIKGVGEQKIAASIAANMAASQTQRAMGALERYYRDYQFQEQLSSQRSGFLGSLFSGIGSMATSIYGMKQLAGGGAASASGVPQFTNTASF